MSIDGAKHYAGIDVGTSGVRMIVIDQAGNVVADARAKMADFSDDHRSTDGWRAAMTSTLRSILAQIPAASIRAISLDGTSGTMLALDDAGAPLLAAKMYNDATDDRAILARIAAHAPPTSAAHGANSALARAISLQSGAGVGRLVHQADWLSGLLSGRFDRTDENNALKTGYDPISRCWPDWLSETGVQVEKLPEVLEPGSLIGPALGPLATEVGLLPETVIVAGTTDGCASFLATGAADCGDGVTALGTTLTIKMLSDQPVFAPELGIYSHRMPMGWLAGGASNTGGNVLAAYFDGERIAELSQEIDPMTETGLRYYPLLKPGERFPHNDPEWQPVMTPRPSSDVAFLKAIFEGIARIEAEGFQKLHALGTPKLRSMRTVGGGALNPVWTTMRQRMLGVDFFEPSSDQAAYGTALLARRGAVV